MSRDLKRQRSATAWPDSGRTNHDAADSETMLLRAAAQPLVSGKMLARVLLAAILLFNGAWISGLWVLNKDAGVPQVKADLLRHVTRIDLLLRMPDRLVPATLNSLEGEFQATTADLQRLDGLLPFGGTWPFGTVATEHHLLQMAMDTTQAAQNIITAIPIIEPLLTRVEEMLIHAGESPGAVAGGTPLTIPTINQAQYYLDTARQYWQAAQQERGRLTPVAVAALNEPEASTFLHQYDQLAPTLSTGLELTSSLLDWSPGALGVTAPDHFLLLIMDPSDLRPGGGRVWDYADLETRGGDLVSGISLHSALSLDCPRVTCGVRPIPSTYAWFPLNRNQFGLADADLDPSLPDAASTIETVYQLETGERVDGIVVLTPGLFADLLRVTGPVILPGGSLVVTDANVETLLTAEHETLPATGAAERTSTPDIETLLIQAILTKLAAANTTIQGEIGAALRTAAQSKDLSFFSSSPRVEAMLVQLGMAGDIAAPSGDTLLVSDTNDGPTATNPLVKETIADQVAIDTQGNARHSLSITYVYNAGAAWSGSTPLQPYRDMVRLIVPNGVDLTHMVGSCASVNVSETNFTTAGCQFTLAPGATLVIRANWMVPTAFTGSGRRYSLLVQRQPGADDAVAVRLVVPPGYTFAHPGVRSDVGIHQHGNILTWATDSLTQDTLIYAGLVGAG